jgi:signal transduction histidine kinase/DNA-binding response OmpR family regulator
MAVKAEAVAGFGHWRIDPAEDRVVWSPQMFTITGLDPSTTPTRAMIEALYHPDDAHRIALAMEDARQNGMFADFRCRIIRPDGKTIHVAVSGCCDGPGAILGTMRDITSEMATLDRITAARDEAVTARASLLAAIDDGVRPQIAALVTTIDALRDNPPKAATRRLLEALASSAANMRGVVDAMIGGPSRDTGRILLESANFDLKALVRTTVHLFQPSAAAKSIKFDVHGVDGAPEHVLGDSARVQQMLSNLLSNAIKVTSSGRISITLSPSRATDDIDFWMLVVKDNGRGVEGDAIGRMLSRGDGINAMRDRLHGGQGLELAIGQQIAEAMGGSIAASSDPARGTIFSVELPFSRGAATGPDEQVIGVVSDAPMRILLAEDNPINRRLVAGLLTRNGHDVVVVENGRQALGQMTNRPFDLVIMDMQMPELDGVEATRAIRALDPPPCDTPILAISADAQPERQRIYFEAGINNFLPKPIVSGQLLDMIGKMRRTDPESAPHIGNRFDRTRLNALVAHAGYADAASFIQMLLSDVGDRPNRIAAFIRAEAWELAAIEADALRTLLDSFGSFGLARLLTAVARQCRAGACPPAIMTELSDQARGLLLLLRTELAGSQAA